MNGFPNSRRLALLAAIFQILAWKSPASAQESPQQSPTFFSMIFPHPSGDNGYEEIIMAGDLVRLNAPMNEVQYSDSGATLSAKRAALADPQIRRGLDLLRTGLAKHKIPMHPTVNPETIFPEFALYRNLARVLTIKQTVQLADGDVNGALDTMRETLELGAACGSEILISGLVQVAIDAIARREIGNHLGELSVRDCDKVVSIVRAWLTQPDPSVAVMEGEKRSIANTWELARAEPNRLVDTVSQMGPDTPAEQQANDARKSQIESMARDRQAYSNLIDNVIARSSSRFDMEIANLRQPPWKREPYKPKFDGSLADQLVGILMPTIERASDAFIRDQSLMTMLGAHAAVLRYLWEHDSLPERLEQLRERDLIIDPFAGKTFQYKRTGPRTYELSSIGPFDRGTDERPPSGQRVPLTLVPKPK